MILKRILFVSTAILLQATSILFGSYQSAIIPDKILQLLDNVQEIGKEMNLFLCFHVFLHYSK